MLSLCMSLLRRRTDAAASTAEVPFAQPYRVRLRRSALVTCLSGTAWITRDGQLRDLVLSAGERTRMAGHEDVLVVGLPRCVIRIDPVDIDEDPD
jgi:hypothetical protein